VFLGHDGKENNRNNLMKQTDVTSTLAFFISVPTLDDSMSKDVISQPKAR
jgi:hypothetical protein